MRLEGGTAESPLIEIELLLKHNRAAQYRGKNKSNRLEVILADSHLFPEQNQENTRIELDD